MGTEREVVDTLIAWGNEILYKPQERFDFTRAKTTSGLSARERREREAANDLLNDIETYPHIFVLGTLMARQYDIAKCWLIPYRFIKDNYLGTFFFEALRGVSSQLVADWMSNPPKHRFHRQMGEIFYAGIQKIDQDYAGDASQIWRGNPSAETVKQRFQDFKGAGSKIANMSTHILVHRFKVPLSDLSAIDMPVDTHVRRVFRRLELIPTGLSKAAEKEAIIAATRRYLPAYPAVFDRPAWQTGRWWCHEHHPECVDCKMRDLCPSAAV
jgi:endonuclease III